MKSAETLTYRCPHCGAMMDVETQLVDHTVTCVHCQKPFLPDAPRSIPLDDSAAADGMDRNVVDTSADEERILHTAHPAMFRNHPFLYTAVAGVFFLGLAGLGSRAMGIDLGSWSPSDWGELEGQTLLWTSITLIVISGLYLFVWWIKTRFISLQVTTERSIFQRGFIARRTSEVRHDDVRNLQIDQTIIQRFLGVGTIAISSSGQDDFEIRAKGMPGPDTLAETIRNYQ